MNDDSLDNQTTPLQSIGEALTQRQRKRFKTGDKLLGRYQILGELGQGGMGLVFRCLDEVGGIEVAVKMLPPEVGHDSGEMEEVRENFALVAGLAHPNICTVRTLEKDDATGEYYLVMELAKGVNLRKWRKGRANRPGEPESQYPISNIQYPMIKGSAGPPDPPGSESRGAPGGCALPEILPIMRQIAAALDHAHENKVVHRDVKPSNVMVDERGHAKVLDFGLAAQIHTSFSRVSQVRYGTSGTGPYMAPEQWRGQYQDGATDQYALAVLAYELIAGHCPFESHETTVLKQAVLDNEPARPAGLTHEAWAALRRGLAKGRDERFGSCGEFARALGGEKILLQRAQRTQRAGRGWKWAAGAVVLAGLAAAGIWFSDRNGAPGGRALLEQPPPAPGELYLDTEPSRATFRLLDYAPRTTPVDMQGVPSGIHTARIERADYYATDVVLEIRPDDLLKTNVVLRRHVGAVRLASAPQGAAIYHGGQLRGTTPDWVTDLPTGTQEFRLVLKDYREAILPIKIEVDGRLTHTQKLDRLQGWLKIEAEGLESGARGTLTVKGQSMATALPQVVGPLAPGPADMTFMADAGQTANGTFPVADGKTNSVTLVFRTGPQKGADWEATKLGMKFKWIPPGTFTMGSPTGEANRCSNEGPQHLVAFAQGFWMGQTEVTQAQYEQVMGHNPSNWKGADLPVDSVSWHNAQAFCQEASRILGADVRLPTEAEWEYAARGGPKSRGFIYSGWNDMNAVGWYSDNSGGRTHTVGQKTANELGLHDMSGNVWEWCQDGWHENYNGAPTDGRAWEDSNSKRVVRGGTCDTYASYCRTARREGQASYAANYYFGFRVVLSSTTQ